MTDNKGRLIFGWLGPQQRMYVLWSDNDNHTIYERHEDDFGNIFYEEAGDHVDKEELLRLLACVIIDNNLDEDFDAEAEEAFVFFNERRKKVDDGTPF